jgi:hypothetical protein
VSNYTFGISQKVDLYCLCQRPLLIVSVYLPTKGCHDLDEYIDSIDQLFEIYQKYNLTHDILIGGDINEDLTKKSNDLAFPSFVSVSILCSQSVSQFIYIG